MNDFLAFINSTCWTWVSLLWRAGLSGSLIIVLVWSLCRAWTRMPPAAANWFWRASFLKLLLALVWGASIRLPLLPANDVYPLSSFHQAAASYSESRQGALPEPKVSRAGFPNLSDQLIPTNAGKSQVDLPKPSGSENEPSPLSSLNSQSNGQAAQNSESIFLLSISVKNALVILACSIWLGGTLWLTIQGFLALRLTYQWRRKSTRIDNAELLEDMEQLRQYFGLDKPVPLLSSPEINAMAITGVLQPAILLSPAFSQANPAIKNSKTGRFELRLMLAHELAHQKRRDLAWNWLLWVGQTLFWFHPLVWLAAREWRISQEIACDALAVRATQIPVASYGAMLLKTALVKRGGATEGLFAVGVGARYGALHRRLSAMKHFESMNLSRRTNLVCTSVAILALLPWRLTSQSEAADLVNSPLGGKQLKQDVEVLSLAYSPDGSQLASSGSDSKVRIWDVSTGRLAMVLSGPVQIHSIGKVTFSNDGKTLVSVSDKVRLWNVGTGKLRATLAVANPNAFEKKNYGSGYAVSVALSPSGDMVASTGQFLTVHARNTQGREAGALGWRQAVQQKFFYGTDVSFTPDGKTLIEAGWNGRLNFWNAASLQLGRQSPQKSLPPLKGEPWLYGKANSLSISKNGQWMAIGYGYGAMLKDGSGPPHKTDGKVVLWNLTTGRLHRAWRLPQAAAISVAISPDGRWVACANSDKQKRLWNVDSGELVQSFTGNDFVNSVSFSPDGKTLTTGGADGVIKAWKIAELMNSRAERESRSSKGQPQPISKDWAWEPSFDLADPGAYSYTAKSMRTVTQDAKADGYHKGDMIFEGSPGKLATLKTGGLLLKAQRITVNPKNHEIQAVGKSQPVSIQCRILPKGDGLAVKLEAVCQKADFNTDNGLWLLKGKVRGFYDTDKGRTPFVGEKITISRQMNTVWVR